MNRSGGSSRQCGECGFVPDRVGPADAAVAVRSFPRRWRELLAPDGILDDQAISYRSSTEEWSGLQHAAHLADALRTAADRLARVRTSDRPRLAEVGGAHEGAHHLRDVEGVLSAARRALGRPSSPLTKIERNRARRHASERLSPAVPEAPGGPPGCLTGPFVALRRHVGSARRHGARWRVKFGILGPLEVTAGGQAIELGRPKQRAVLAVLLLSPNRVVSLDRLIEMLWGDEAPASAAGALQAYISNLRRALEPARAARAPAQVLVTQPPGYLLRVPPGDLDAAEFEALAASGRRHLADGRPRAGRQALTEALALWRGPALAEFTFEPFAEREASRLEDLRMVTAEHRWEADLILGHHAQVGGALEVAVSERPLRERLWELLILALYRSGRQGDALRAYERARTILADELGLNPSPSLSRLHADVLAQTPGLDWVPVARPPPPGTGPPPSPPRA